MMQRATEWNQTWGASVKTQPLYTGRTLYQLSYQGAKTCPLSDSFGNITL